MTWLGLVKGLVSLVNGIVGFLDRRQLIEAGKATAARDGLAKTLEAMEKADEAEDAIDHDPHFADVVRKRSDRNQ